MEKEYQLPKQWIDYLTKQPESGQGYQVGDIHFTDGTILEDIAIFNAERFFSEEPDLDLSKIEKIIMKE